MVKELSETWCCFENFLKASHRPNIAHFFAKHLDENDEHSSLQDGMTPLHQAARHGHVEVLEAMRQTMGIEKFQACRWTSQKTGMTPLHVAASQGQIDFVREIIAYMPANIKSDPPNTGEQFKDLIAEVGSQRNGPF